MTIAPGDQVRCGREPLQFGPWLPPGRPKAERGDPAATAAIDCSVKAAMGHSRITTTERYLHARSASDMAERFTDALAPTSSGQAALRVSSR